MPNMNVKLALAASVVAGAFMLSAPASAVCDITTTKCWGDDSKCNIHFRNHTAHAAGDSGGTHLSQASLVQTVRIKAVKENGNSAGNTVNVLAGEKGTMNLDNKEARDFDHIRISSGSDSVVKGTTMSCEDIIAVLNANGTCKIFNGQEKVQSTILYSTLGYSCDEGNIGGPD